MYIPGSQRQLFRSRNSCRIKVPRDYMVSNLDRDFIFRHSPRHLRAADSTMCRTRTWCLLRAQEIVLEAGVAMLMRPECKGNGGEIVDQWNGVAVFCQVDSLEIELAGVASFDADVGQLLSNVDRQLGFGLFATRRAMNPPKFPFLRTK